MSDKCLLADKQYGLKTKLFELIIVSRFGHAERINKNRMYPGILVVEKTGRSIPRKG